MLVYAGVLPGVDAAAIQREDMRDWADEVAG
jgi:hypothetical protein